VGGRWGGGRASECWSDAGGSTSGGGGSDGDDHVRVESSGGGARPLRAPAPRGMGGSAAEEHAGLEPFTEGTLLFARRSGEAQGLRPQSRTLGPAAALGPPAPKDSAANRAAPEVVPDLRTKSARPPEPGARAAARRRRRRGRAR
jgi:hypothetical protein